MRIDPIARAESLRTAATLTRRFRSGSTNVGSYVGTDGRHNFPIAIAANGHRKEASAFGPFSRGAGDNSSDSRTNCPSLAGPGSSLFCTRTSELLFRARRSHYFKRGSQVLFPISWGIVGRITFVDSPDDAGISKFGRQEALFLSRSHRGFVPDL